MAKALDVYLHQDFTGQLMMDRGQMVFKYAPAWLENPKALPLSHSLPLQQERFSSKLCRGFFAGILPEESKREIVARNLGISKANDYAMLEQIGGECAGAVTFIPAGTALPPLDYHYRKLTDDELLEILTLLPRRPLMAGEEGIRLSLAGAQDKIAVHVSGENISVPLGGAPSTHILKPAIERFEGLVFNEAFCMQLAKAVDLPVANTEIRKIGTVDYLLVERYDRHVDPKGNIHRVHQEDFCQALGIVSEQKYQSEGGPSLKDCFKLLREISSRPVIDLANLLDGVIFNLLIGNHDAHGKNFSLLYGTQRTASQLAPFYDLVSTVYYPELSPRMAMKFGKEAESSRVTRRHLEKFAQEAELAVPMVRKRANDLTHRVLSQLGEVNIDHPVASQLTELIEGRCHRFLRQLANLG
jgi:serine/threonine-protein kinase HipA